jgi:hypothetical protein
MVRKVFLVRVEDDPLWATLSLVAECDVLEAVESLDNEQGGSLRSVSLYSRRCEKLADRLVTGGPLESKERTRICLAL